MGQQKRCNRPAEMSGAHHLFPCYFGELEAETEIPDEILDRIPSED